MNAGTTRCIQTLCWAPQWCTERPWGWGARSLCPCPGARFPLPSRKDCGYVQTGPLVWGWGWTLLSVGHAKAVERNQSIFCHLVTRQLYRVAYLRIPDISGMDVEFRASLAYSQCRLCTRGKFSLLLAFYTCRKIVLFIFRKRRFHLLQI